MNIALIGRGRVATHMGKALLQAGHQLTSVNSRTLAELPQHADIYIIAVKDSALQEVIEHLCSRLQTSTAPFREGMGVGSFCLTPHIATLCIVFPITLFTGFWLQKNVTFTTSRLKSWKQLSRYIFIVAINLAVNYFGLKLCVETFGWYPTPSKMLITLITVAISYFGQKYYSFRVSKN